MGLFSRTSSTQSNILRANGARVYLDWAASAPISDAFRIAFIDALRVFGNPSSPHREGEEALHLLTEARHTIAGLAGVKPSSVIFTSGATEANVLAIKGHIDARLISSLSSDKPHERLIHVLYLPTAHASVIETVHALEKSGVIIEPLIIRDGEIDVAALTKQIRPETVLVSMDLVCGETGTKYDPRTIRRTLDAARVQTSEGMTEEKNERILLHVDASQAPLTESFENNRLGADLVTLDAQKVGAVRGIGALIRAHTLLPLTPQLYGGGQEFELRPGTENPALASAFAKALTEAAAEREAFRTRAQSARDALLATLSKSFPTMEINVGKHGAPHILNISFPGVDTDYAVVLLSEAGFAVSTKSACETNEAGSRTVRILTNDQARADATLRISWGPTTTSEELECFARALTKVLQFLTAN